MRYEDKTAKNYSLPLFRRETPKNRVPGADVSEDCHGASLIGFLILCNQLSPNGWILSIQIVRAEKDPGPFLPTFVPGV